MTDYQLNRLYSATVDGEPGQRVAYADPTDRQLPWFHLPATEGHCGMWVERAKVSDVRPLVTLDFGPGNIPSDEAARYLRAAKFAVQYSPDANKFWEWLIAQVEEQTGPPRIPEPGKWGVVRDSNGEDWFRRGITQGTSYEWVNVETGVRADWKDIEQPVEVRPGV